LREIRKGSTAIGSCTRRLIAAIANMEYSLENEAGCEFERLPTRARRELPMAVIDAFGRPRA